MILPNDIIEGSYRVVSTGDPSNPPFRKSPNRKRAVARIVIWNIVLLTAAIYVPGLLA